VNEVDGWTVFRRQQFPLQRTHQAGLLFLLIELDERGTEFAEESGIVLTNETDGKKVQTWTGGSGKKRTQTRARKKTRVNKTQRKSKIASSFFVPSY